MIECDKRDNIDKRPMQRANNHLNELIKTVKSCGVSFNVWEKMDANGKGSGQYDFTSLMGSDKKRLLRALPSKLGGVIRPEISSNVVKLWKDFGELYELVGLQNQTSDKILEYFNKAASWINLFTSLRGKMMGHEKARVTPYMHAMAYHVPGFIERHQGIKKFTGQGVEKLNDDCRRIHLRRSNKWDAPKDVLLVGKRIEGLSDCERVARKYEKQKQSYWNGTIIESRSKRHRLCVEEIATEIDPLTLTEGDPATKIDLLTERNPIAEKNPVDFDVNCLTCKEIKLKLQEMGVKTRLRCKKKLQELLIQELAMTTVCNKENVQQE